MFVTNQLHHQVCFYSKLIEVEDNDYPFRNEERVHFQFIREVIEEEPALMTNRQLAEWLAKGNGQMKFEESFVCSKNLYVYPYDVYDIEKENDAVKGNVRIRLWDSDEWIVREIEMRRDFF